MLCGAFWTQTLPEICIRVFSDELFDLQPIDFVISKKSMIPEGSKLSILIAFLHSLSNTFRTVLADSC